MYRAWAAVAVDPCAWSIEKKWVTLWDHAWIIVLGQPKNIPLESQAKNLSLSLQERFSPVFLYNPLRFQHPTIFLQLRPKSKAHD